ncbi:TBC1 domain family member 23 [Toxocara canis]|uniref:TBC1 domain family member 23 n=1 Tax=Toxocara canis TaxID=6265 RepID=A0A0B2USN2_TOXCA|nr:TBC1 domain family member 23 [Toxocara canis]
MEEDIKSDSTLGDDWVRESGSSPLETARDAEAHLSEGLSDIENEVEQLALDGRRQLPQIKHFLVERYRRTWPKYLGTHNKPSIPHEFIYDGEDVDVIRDECGKLAERNGMGASEARELEKVVGLFCEREECRFEVEWMSVLEMLIPFLSSLDFVYNAFCAITTKYLPRSTAKGAICYHLMHLILQYHDPALSTHLTSHKLNCYDFAYPCFSSLFVRVIDRGTLYSIWDKYFEKDFQRVLFGSRLVNVRQVDVADLLALPVDPRDLVRLTTDENSNALEPGFGFFIIDARPHGDYTAGHLEGSYNLDSSLFVEAPERYKIALSSLDAYRNASRRNHHLLFLGSGREECDLYLNMVVANFLQQSRKHVALVQGALHQLLVSNLERLEGHCAQRCKECEVDRVEGNMETPSSRKPSWMTGVSNLFGAVKASAPALTEKVLNLAQSSRAAEAHVATSERHGKRYRNERSVFTLSDSDSEPDNVIAVLTGSPNTAQPRKLSEILAQDDILEHFEGVEVLSDGRNQKTVNCYLALTRTHIHVLHQTDKVDEVITQSRHAYGSVLRVSSKKKLPEMITFKFGYTTDDGEYKETCLQRFVLPRAGDCVKAIKMNIVNLQPSLLM